MTKIVHRGKIFYFKDGHYVLVEKRPQTDIYDFSLYDKFNQFVRKHPFSGIQPTYLRDYAQHIADSFDYSTALAGRGLNLVVSKQGKETCTFLVRDTGNSVVTIDSVFGVSQEKIPFTSEVKIERFVIHLYNERMC